MDTVAVKVLLVENEQNGLSRIREMLSLSSDQSLQLQLVHGIEEAKKAMLNADYDVCLLDERISEQRGVDLVYRASLVRFDAPFVLLAQSDDYELDVAVMRAGAVSFLVADQVTSELLTRTIRHAIDRKRIETTLNQTQQKAVQLAAIVEGSDYAILGKTTAGIITSWNRAATALYGYTAEEVIGQPVGIIAPSDRPNEIEALLARIGRGEKVQSFETVRVSKDGRLIDVSLTISPMRDSSGRIIGASSIAQDIRQRKEAEKQIEKQILRIQALRNIDMAITGSLDLRVTLNVLLDQVTTHLKVDSAAVLLLNPHTQRLQHSTGRGFRSNSLHRTNLRIGQCAAGRAAHEREIVTIPDLSKDPGDYERLPMISGEDFVSYWAAPLIAKGHVEGILEIYHRSKFEADPDWFDFLETLAGQAAIAIENADLFNDLQRSNVELQIAYDSTLEGWSKALDLRDRETVGHTQRVTEGTMAMGRAMKISDCDLVQVRRGALLHDIGKMGIPDAILLKAGALTESEWSIMKKHPDYAFELLAPIPYLRGALDIPYCHHEKWDGSGYPRGLKGEHIPLAARMFAVVDVWDALRSNRPYRPAWSEDKVREHIEAGSGSHFDPDMIATFLNIEF